MEACLRIDGTEFNLLTVFEALTRINELWIRAHPDAPDIYSAGIRYIPRTIKPELWPDIPNIIRAHGHDCDGLACWRAAELRVAGYKANVILRRYKKDYYHALVEITLPDGTLAYDDPSARLGMFDPRGPHVAGVPAQLWNNLSNDAPSSLDEHDPDAIVETLSLRRFVRGANDVWVSDPGESASMFAVAINADARTSLATRLVDVPTAAPIAPSSPSSPTGLRRVGIVTPREPR